MRDKKFIFDVGIDAWVKGIEIEEDLYDEALETLYAMTLGEILEHGDLKSFDLKNISHEVEEDEIDFMQGDELEKLIAERIPGYVEDGITDPNDLVEKLDFEASKEDIEFSWSEALQKIVNYLDNNFKHETEEDE